MARTNIGAVSTRRGWIALFLVAAIAIVVGNYGYKRLATAIVHRSAIEQLSSVGEFKANMIEAWRTERMSDGYGSAYSPFFRYAFEDWLASGNDEPLEPLFQEYLEVDRSAYGFADVLLLAPDGRVLVSATGDEHPAGPQTHEAMRTARELRMSVMTDFYFSETGDGPFLDTVALIPDSSGAPLGYIVLRSDARDYLFPILAQWPSLSGSAETMLVRREGDHVLFLNALRHADSPIFSTQFSLSDTEHPAVQAVLGAQGLVEGKDYRGVRVLADVRPITGTPWFLVAKVDASELLADARYRVRVASIIALLCVLLVGGAIAYLYRIRQSEVYEKLDSAKQSERRTLEEVRTTLYSIGDAVITTDTSGRIRRMNPVAEALTGWQESEATGKPLEEVFHVVNEASGEVMESPVECVLRQGGIVDLAENTLLIARDGTARPIADSGAPILDDSGVTTGVVLVFRDQSDEHAVQRAMRESEERFRGLYESAAVGILIHDAETGEVVDANRKAITDYGLETLEELQAYDMWGEPPYSMDDAQRIIRKVLEEGPQRVEWKSRAVDGREFWEEVTTCAAPMDGTTRIISIAHDITARKLAEQALEKTTDELERFFLVSVDLLCIAGPDSTFLKLNDAWERVLGYPKDELLGRFFMDFVHPDDRDATLEAMKVLADRQPVDAFVNRYRTADGSYRFIEWRASCPDGDRIFAAARDITARKAAEIERQRLFTLLTEAESMARMGAWEMDVATLESSWSDELYALHELDKTDKPNLDSALSYYPPKYRAKMADAVLACIERLEPFDVVSRFITAKGNDRWVRVSGKPIVENGKAVRLVGMVQDITKQQVSEAALERELAFSKRLLDAMADGFALLDAQGIIVDANPAFCEMTGLTREELVGQGPPHSYWPIEEREIITAAFSETLELRPQTYELIFQRSNGERFPALVSPSFLLDSQGIPINYFATVKDMSERKRAEEERERLLSAIEQSSESIIITDAEGMIQYVNPAFERISGYSREDAMGVNPSILKSGDQSSSYYRDLWKTITSGETWHGRLRNRRKDGTLFTEDATISPVRDRAGNIVNFVAVKRDIGREEELEAQLRQSQKMDAVGRLAGGIAHDFNNMLGVILGHTEMCLEQVEPGSSLEEDLLQIQSAGKRSADLTRQLLSFARRQTIAPKVLDLNRTVEDLLGMIRPIIGEDIVVDWRPGADLCAVRLDPGQVDQILMNLAVNARDAIAGVGRITIQTCNQKVTATDEITLPGMKPGRYVVLTMVDTGCGMEEAVLERVFEPFFSTKSLGHGTGLGLATVYGIVKQNEGFIEAKSTPGDGATFRIYLPAYDAPMPTQEDERRPRISQHPSGLETILLVEDEASLLAVGTRFLERLGYTVLPAPGPKEALAIGRRMDQHIDLLLTDVVMPEMTGREVWELLHPLRPDLKCLFVSGYTADIMADHGVMNETVHFLQKPFTMKTLAAKVRELLGDSTAGIPSEPS